MKLIDKKGKLLGLINIIDFIIVLLLILLIPTLYYAIMLFTKKTPLKTVSRVLPVLIYKIPNTEIDSVCVGDKEYSKNDSLLAELVDIKKTSYYIDSVTTGDSRGKIGIVDSNYKMIYGDIKVVAKKINDKFVYKKTIFKDGNYHANEGKKLIFKTSKYEYFCEVRQPEFEPLKKKIKYIDTLSYQSLIRFSKCDDEDESILSKTREIYLDSSIVAGEILKIVDISNDSFQMIINGITNDIIMNKKRIDMLFRTDYQLGIDKSIYWNGQNVSKTGKINLNIKGNSYQAEMIKFNYKKKMVKIAKKEITIVLNITCKEKLELMKKLIKNSNKIKNVKIDHINEKIGTKWYKGFSVDEIKIYEVLLKIELNCIQNDNGFVYNAQNVKVGNNLLIEYPKFDLNGCVLYIE